MPFLIARAKLHGSCLRVNAVSGAFRAGTTDSATDRVHSRSSPTSGLRVRSRSVTLDAMRAALVAIVVACTPSAAPPPTRPAVATAPAAKPPPLGTEMIVIRSPGAASRQDASPRILRRIVAARRGLVEIADGYTLVSLKVDAVLSGALDDPSYASRPIGTNRLPVVLVDEAAYAAPSSLDGFEGTWRLTKLDDGTLVASAIEDTPFGRGAVEKRRQRIAEARERMRRDSVEERLEGLEMVRKVRAFELVPDAIALLDDDRQEPPRPTSKRPFAPRTVREVAERWLRGLVDTLHDPRAPATNRPDAWDAYWRLLTAAPMSPRAVTPSALAEILTIPMPQSWPGLVAIPEGFVAAVSRLDPRIDGNEDGLVIVRGGARTWVHARPAQAVDAALGPSGLGVLHEDGHTWILVIASQRATEPKRIVLDFGGRVSRAALAASDNGFVVVGIMGTTAIAALQLDAKGNALGKAKTIRLTDVPSGMSVHGGMYPIAIARKPGGYLVAVETGGATRIASLDDTLKLTGVPNLIEHGRMSQPKIAVGDRAFLAWKDDDMPDTVAVIVTDLEGKPISTVSHAGSEVQIVSRPVALDDGSFAVAWIEGRSIDELHVGRWSAAGERIADVVIQARDAAPFTITLARDGAALVVGFEDTSRYPYRLVSRRLELTSLK
jgi:hypothetical protein